MLLLLPAAYHVRALRVGVRRGAKQVLLAMVAHAQIGPRALEQRGRARAPYRIEHRRLPMHHLGPRAKSVQPQRVRRADTQQQGQNCWLRNDRISIKLYILIQT